MMTEEELFKSVIEISKKDTNIDNRFINNQSNEQKISPSVQFIIDMGFTFEEAIMALSAVGDDPEIMLNFLYSVNHY